MASSPLASRTNPFIFCFISILPYLWNPNIRTKNEKRWWVCCSAAVTIWLICILTLLIFSRIFSWAWPVFCNYTAPFSISWTPTWPNPMLARSSQHPPFPGSVLCGHAVSLTMRLLRTKTRKPPHSEGLASAAFNSSDCFPGHSVNLSFRKALNCYEHLNIPLLLAAQSDNPSVPGLSYR